MKITKEKLQEIIKEEITTMREMIGHNYDEPSPTPVRQNGISPGDLNVSANLRDAMKDMTNASIHMAYRLYGEGTMKRRDDGHPSLTEPFLSTFDKQKVYRVRLDVEAAIELVKGALKDLEGIDLGSP